MERGVQLPPHLPHPGQLLVENLPLMLRQSCARTDTVEGGCRARSSASSPPSPHPGQLLVENLPLLLRQSCARTDTAEGGWLGTGCKEEIASPS